MCVWFFTGIYITSEFLRFLIAVFSIRDVNIYMFLSQTKMALGFKKIRVL